MARLYSAFLPGNEFLGALWALTGVKDAAVILHSTAGCNYYYLVSAPARVRELIYNRYASTGLEEVEIALGGSEEKLEGALKKIAREKKPSLIAVIANPVSSLIGVDVESVVKEAAPDLKVPVITFTGGGWSGNSEDGVRQVLLALVKTLCPGETLSPLREKGKREKPYVNIIGPTAETWNWASDRHELKRLLAFLDLEMGPALTYETDTREIAACASACLTIVTREAGLAAARYLEEHHHIPYLYGLPFGLNGTRKWLEQVARLTGRKLPDQGLSQELDTPTLYKLAMTRGGAGFPRQLRVAIAAPYAYAVGLIPMVQEDWNSQVVALRLPQDPGERARQELAALGAGSIQVGDDEDKWRQTLEETNPQLLLGSAADKTLFPQVPLHLLLTEPAYDTLSLYDGTPILGWQGYRYLTQTLFNSFSQLKGRPTPATIGGQA